MADEGGPPFQIIHWLKSIHSSPQRLCTVPGELDDGRLGVSDTKVQFDDPPSSSTGGPLLAMEDSEDRASAVSGSTSQPLSLSDRPILKPKAPSSRGGSPTRMRKIMSLLEQGNPPIRFRQPSPKVTQPSEVATLRRFLFKDHNVHVIPVALEVSVTLPRTLQTGPRRATEEPG